MGRFDRLPGIDEANRRRRNILIGAGYALAGCVALGAAAPDDDEDTDAAGGTDGADGTPEPTPTPGQTPEATATPTEEPTPEPTDEPTATPTAAPPEAGELGAVSNNAEWLDPATSRSGSGQAVTDAFEAARFTAFVYEHDGQSNFSIELIDDESGETVDILVNEIGPVAGAVGIGLPESRYILDVDADGDWAIELGEPVAPDGEWGVPPATIAGEQPDVYGEVEIDGRVTVTGKHEGRSNFAVLAWDEMSTSSFFPDEVIFNEIGDFEGETSVQLSGLFYITVDADGPYQVSIE